MISTILLTAVSFLAVPPAVCPVRQEGEPQKTVDVAARMEEAGGDVAKLWALVEELDQLDMSSEAREVCNKILELDPNHEEAHKKLRHHFYDGQWFTSYTALSKYRREEAKRMLEEKGLVRFNDEWVPQEDVTYLRMGWTKNEGGQWVNPADEALAKQVAAYIEEGRQQRTEDSSWIHPDDFSKWQEGLFQCGDEWVSKEAANEYHKQIGQWWQWQGKYFVALSTLDYENTNWAVWYADNIYDDLVRAVGLTPSVKPEFAVLNSVAQYNAFAGGDQAAGIQPSEQSGWSSIHYAFFADTAFVPTQPPTYRGMGVAFWARDDQNLDWTGQYSIRHAAALSYLEKVDPSWNAVSELVASFQSGGGNQSFVQTFWSEKKIPMWLHYGIASYCERYAPDETVGQDGNRWWMRDWAFEQVRAKENIRKLTDIFAFNLDLNDIPTSQALVQEAGLLVSFMLDGPSDAVRNAHQAFKGALKSGDTAKIQETVTTLQNALVENEGVLRNYVGL